jgi:hypothetical protein
MARLTKEQNSKFNQLLEVVKSQTAAFKVNYLDLVKSNADYAFDRLPDKISASQAKIKALKKSIQNCCKEKRDTCGRLNSADLDAYIAQTNPMRKDVEKLERFTRQSKNFLKMGKEKFIETMLEEAEQAFDSKVFALADKLNKKGFSTNCKFSYISRDPKLFDTIITSGLNKVHARSILAAADSEYMVAHFRFIITNAK